MASYRHAFSLSKDEVRDAEPPGTVRLISASQLHTTCPSSFPSPSQQNISAVTDCRTSRP
jgi:hypothetical protein